MMAKPRVLITTHYLEPGHEVDQYLQSAGVDTVFSPKRRNRTEDEMIDLLQDMDGVFASSDPYTARVINAASKLKVIVKAAAGYDSIDLRAATARGIPVCTTPGANRHAVAEWAITLMLVCARKGLANLTEVRERGWTRHEGIDVTGKTLGIIGMGAIGREVAQRMRAFEMAILAYDVRQDAQFAEEHDVTYVPLEQLLRESDFVTIHALLSHESHHLINDERLALMKPSAYLINTARGALVDTDALYRALKEKRIAGAALDVFEEEPLGESALRDLENLCLSPHAAGSTSDARRIAPFIAADDLLRVLRGERAQYAVNPEVYTVETTAAAES